MNSQANSNAIKNLALSFGFDACGIAKARELSAHTTYLKTWLDNGYHADMHWMANHLEKRIDPTKLVDGAKSVIVVLKNYYPNEYRFGQHDLKISRYALGKDYHNVIKIKLKQLLNQLKLQMGPMNGRCFVDSAPILERAWAVEAGLGWIGKNSLLLNRNLGSFFFIGEIIVDIELEYNIPTKSYCGNCTACIDNCPTKAITSPSVVDSNKCISYHTIENKGEIPENVCNNMNGRIFGCDICQEACPWNNKAQPHHEADFNPLQEITVFKEKGWEILTETEFNAVFKNSAVKRTGYTGLMRNISVALKNKP
jgi:epoxyqueuosine reductase